MAEICGRTNMGGEIEARVRELAEPLLRSMGLELWGVRYHAAPRRARLQIFIESEAGISADTCGEVTNVLSPALDVADLIAPAYTLEVSSPGLDRELFSLEQIGRYAGRRIRVRTRGADGGQHRFEGLLKGVEHETLQLEDAQSGLQAIAYVDVVQARLVPDFPAARPPHRH